MSSPAIRFFDSSARDYEIKHYAGAVRSFMTVRQQRVLEFVDSLSLPAGARVLDAGCGPGYLLEALATRGFHVCGVDAAHAMLERARRRVSTAHPALAGEFKLGSIEALPYEDASFDLVCSTGVIEYLRDDVLALAEMHRVLKPGGSLLLPVTNLRSPINWLDFVLEFLKRQAPVRNGFNAVWQRLGHQPVLPRHFPVRRHDPVAFRASLERAGFRVKDDVYFHFLPWPHPLDQFFPDISAQVGRAMERFGRSWVGPLAEGYLVLATSTD